MSATHDFSRRFFADFIASRIRAWKLEGGESRPTPRTLAAVAEHRPNALERDSSDARHRSTPRTG
jgi:hypothetical protein